MPDKRVWHILEEKAITSLSYQPFWIRTTKNEIILFQRMDAQYAISESGTPSYICLFKDYGYTHWSYVNQELENKPIFNDIK